MKELPKIGSEWRFKDVRSTGPADTKQGLNLFTVQAISAEGDIALYRATAEGEVPDHSPTWMTVPNFARDFEPVPK